MGSPILKEWCVMGPQLLHQFGTGLILAYPAVLKPALVNGTGIKATSDEASWIAAFYPMTGGFGFLFLPFLMQSYGRKFINVLINVIVIIGWLIIALSPDVATLITGRAVQGLAFGSLYLCGIITSEYSHPKRRGFYIVIKHAGTGAGELFCHGFGFYMTWRQLAWLAIIPPAIAAVSTLTWKESPSWLAYKERYEDCAATLEWLRGKNPESNREMMTLILAQKEINRSKSSQGSVARVLTSLRSDELMKPFRIVFVLLALEHLCGRHFFQAEIPQIMVSLTGDRSKAYFFTIVFDCMKIFALIISSYIVRKFRRRIVFFCAGSVACLLLGPFCLIDLMVSQGILNVKWLAPHAIGAVFKGELIPLQHKGVGVTLIGISSANKSMVLMKSTAKLLELIQPRGTFSIYLVLAICCLLYLNFVIPETKDKSLQDIELQFMNVKLRNDFVCEDFTGKVSETKQLT